MEMLKHSWDFVIAVGSLIFLTVCFLIPMIFWPIISFEWITYLHNGDEDVKKFFRFGIIGSVAIGGIALFWFVAYPWNALIYIPAIALYATGTVLQFKLISQKIEEERRVLANQH